MKITSDLVIAVFLGVTLLGSLFCNVSVELQTAIAGGLIGFLSKDHRGVMR